MKVICIVLCLLALSTVYGQTCPEFTATNGAKYANLAILSRGVDYSGSETGTSYTYNWNFCKNLASTTCLNPTPTTQVSTTGTCTPLGYLATMQIKDHPKGPNEGVQITYINNLDNKCNGNTINRVTNIIATCDTSLDYTFTGITEPDVCVYQISVKSKNACPTKKGSGGGGGDGGLSGGSVFLIILLCVVVLYLAVGSLVMWKVKGHSGVEVIPNYEFWKDVPVLVKDGFNFVRFKVTGYSSV